MRRHVRAVRGTYALLLIGLVSAPVACGRFGNADNTKEGRRLVSVSKQHTEILYAIGAEKDLVAVDVSSVYPPATRQLPTVGYHRALSLEGMLAAKPTLLITGGRNNMGPEPVVQQIEALKIPTAEFAASGSDLESTKALIREMGTYFQQESRADSVVKTLEADMARALSRESAPVDTPSVVIIHYGRANNTYLTILGKSVAGQMVRWAGGRMALPDSAGMRQLTSPEIIAKADPDVILLTDFGYDRLAGLSDVLALPGVGSTKAARNGRIYRVEENDLVYFGPRTGRNVEALRALLHPAPGS
ncbi:MAG: ABC transporter substrate-binding protein [Gemmatimonadaceae bacterium]|nr:ABC transporter substrate-binding protein [Gemmatimonadaceae bacterium]